MVEVSVLVIAYNHNPFIAKCIDSILCQETDFEYEILIHDDNSTDGTKETIRQYEKKYPKLIKAIIEEENQFSKGKTHPDEFLFPYVRGKYIAMVEGDDFWCDNKKLQKQYIAMESNKTCSICVHPVQLVDSSNNLLNDVLGKNVFCEEVMKREDVLSEFFCKNNWVFQTGSFFMRATVLMNRPDFWSKFYVGDLPIILWFAYNGDFCYINQKMSCYRIFSEGSATSLNRKRDYAIRKAKTNAEGLIAFNEYTDGIFWSYLKHITSYYVYHYYASTKQVVSQDYLNEACKELKLKEKVLAQIKYTKLGYFIRNLREDVLKKGFKRGYVDEKNTGN